MIWQTHGYSLTSTRMGPSSVRRTLTGSSSVNCLLLLVVVLVVVMVEVMEISDV